MFAQDTKSELLEAHIKLRNAAQKAASSIIHETKLLSSFEFDELENQIEEVVEKRLVRGIWIPIFEGVKMMLIDDNDGWTRALCQGNAVSPKHYHTYFEKIIVIDGQLQEVTTGQIYLPGSTVAHEPYKHHQPSINGVVMMMWKPPLPDVSIQPSASDPVIYHLI
jgi:hypothetical protein